ncbi:hypothetical protein B6U99_06020 [Candidatus Geothermarchaeota archaeon ex4572_27]|nr:MAG: hypothetical protein B6U99_06020 [Candidatus Geothermarchaeota archaeon ex4572_27]
MTGEAEGKLRVPSRAVLELEGGGFRGIEPDVFIHVKGYSMARVTHLDIEHEELDGLLPPGDGRFLEVRGIKGGLKVTLDPPSKGVRALIVESGLLNHVLRPGEATRAWVGGKHGGIYIGFRKAEVERLEGLATRLYGVKPRCRR